MILDFCREWTPEENKVFLEIMKKQKIAYCKENDLPIPDFTHEEDYLIPTKPLSVILEYGKSFIDKQTIRITKTYDIPLECFVIDRLPVNCSECPKEYQNIPKHHCGFDPLFDKVRPPTCRLRTINEFLKEHNIP